jgi:hypothetical protein
MPGFFCSDLVLLTGLPAGDPMQNNSNPVLMPGEPPVALTPAEQKQIRDALCGVAMRGLRHNGELEDMRVRLSREFAQLKSDCALAQKVKA